MSLVVRGRLGTLCSRSTWSRSSRDAGHPYRYLDRCESTQHEPSDDAPEGAVVVADEQTAGGGRPGRPWLAAPGTSLLFSVNLRPPVETSAFPRTD